MGNRFVIPSFLAICLACTGTQKAFADNNLLVILDASNSMWGQIDGTPKIDIAKDVLGDLMQDLPDAVQLGLLVYGHREKGDCNDVELIAGFGDADRDALITSVQGLSPRGKTPIAQSLKISWTAFEGHEEDNNSVVLISDGIETCDADPCVAARELAERGVNVEIHTVGFDVDTETKAQLQCIADAGGGNYFDASDAAGLQKAVAKVKDVVVEAPATEPEPIPEPEPTPTPQIVFEDTFDGDFLLEHWSVEKPDPNGYLVENGELIIAEGKTAVMESGEARNIFRLSGFDLPKGNWTATTSLTYGVQTSREIISLAVYDEPTSYVAAEIYSDGDKYYGWSLNLRIIKVAGENRSEFIQPIAKFGCNVCGPDQMFDTFGATLEDPITLQLVKEGRALYARAKLSGEQAEWIETDKISTLRLKGDLSVNLSEWEDTRGESYFRIDDIKIEVLK